MHTVPHSRRSLGNDELAALAPVLAGNQLPHARGDAASVENVLTSRTSEVVRPCSHHFVTVMTNTDRRLFALSGLRIVLSSIGFQLSARLPVRVSTTLPLLAGIGRQTAKTKAIACLLLLPLAAVSLSLLLRLAVLLLTLLGLRLRVLLRFPAFGLAARAALGRRLFRSRLSLAGLLALLVAQCSDKTVLREERRAVLRAALLAGAQHRLSEDCLQLRRHWIHHHIR